MATEVTMTKSEFQKRWRAFKEGIGIDLVQALQRRCPVDSGRLRESIKYTVSNRAIRIKMADYALYVEFGTAPHIIRPKNAKALAFARFGGRRVQHKDGTVSTEFKFGGKTTQTSAVIVKEVHHPGTDAQPFIRTTLRMDFKNICEKNMRMHLINGG